MRRLSRSGKFSIASAPVRRVRKVKKQRCGRRLTVCVCMVLIMLISLLSAPMPARTQAADSAADDASLIPETEAQIPIPVFLSQGDRGRDVCVLQEKLRALGYDPGSLTGVYTLATASAVKAFQEDAGLCSNGICDAAVSACLDAAAARQSGDKLPSVSVQELLSALAAAGCCPDMQDTEDAVCLVRRALTLFQRTHGLCGTGEVNDATLYALGLRCGETDTSADAACGAVRDMDISLLVRALASFRAENKGRGSMRAGGMRGDDLCLLTACAEVLLNRTRSPLFPDTLDAVCAQGVLTGLPVGSVCAAAYTGMYGGGADAKDALSGSDTALLLRAAENALLLYPRTGTGSRNISRDGIARGALYVYRAADVPQPRDTAGVQIGDFVFTRRRIQTPDTEENTVPG
ncbi:MAG: peptidoglycan-binding protein [Eubacteriales bacterium]